VVNYKAVLERINTKMEIECYVTLDKARANTAASHTMATIEETLGEIA
jgi:hypothetical protein